MDETAAVPEADELERIGLHDPAAPDADDRLAVIQYVLARGATLDDVRRSASLGELALDLHLRPRTEQTLGEVVESLALDWRMARRLLAASGMPFDPDATVTADEAAMLELLSVTADFLGEEAAFQITRVMGAAMARIAEALVTAFRLQYEVPRLAAGTPYLEVVKEYVTIADSLLPPFVTSLDAILRRQLLAVADRMWGTDEERSAVTLPRTVGFIDLVGYTAAAATMSARELTAVLVAFDEQVAEAVLEGGGQVIKTIGDEALFVTEDPAAGCRIGLALVERFGNASLPPARVGMSVGEVVSVFGDVYGPDVNLASRLVGAAEPSTVYVSGELCRRCGDRFSFEPVAPLTLKGFADPVTAFRLSGTVLT